MKNVTDFRKTVETGVDPRQLRFYHFEPKSIVLGYFNTIPDTKYEHVSDMWLSTSGIWRSAASLRYRNRAQITVLMYEQKSQPVMMVFVPAQKLSNIVWTKPHSAFKRIDNNLFVYESIWKNAEEASLKPFTPNTHILMTYLHTPP